MEEQLKVQNEFIVWFTVLGVIFLMLMVYLYHAKKQPNPFQKQLSAASAFIIFAAIAFVIRLAIAYSLPGYMTDMDCFKAWANYSYEGGLSNFYTSDFFADYPPLYIYALYFLGFLRDAFSVDITSPMFAMMIRLPAMICDIVAAYAVYRIARKKLGNTTALFLSMFLLLNPAVIFNSSAWGQMDIMLTLMLVSYTHLIEKAETAFEEKSALELQKKISKDQMTLEDFLDQMEQLQDMGSLSDILAMMPGGNKLKGMTLDEKQLERTKAIVRSMTIEERRNPQVINASRRRRISAGSGTTVQEVNRLLNQFDQMKKMLKQFSGKGGKKRGMMGRMPFGM